MDLSICMKGKIIGNHRGLDIYFTYMGGDGNDVGVYTVPEPGSVMLLACGLFGMIKRSRSLTK